MTDKVFEFLRKPQATKLQIRSKLMQIEDLRLMMLPSGIRYDKDAVQTSPGDPMAAYAERLDDLEREVRNLRRQYLAERDAIAWAVEQLPEMRERVVLVGRYVRGLSYDDIAAELGMSTERVYQLRRSGVKSLDALDSF